MLRRAIFGLLVLAAALAPAMAADPMTHTLLGGKASIMLPDDLVKMSGEALKAKFPANAPQEAFSTKDGSVTLGVGTEPYTGKASHEILVSVMTRKLEAAKVVKKWGRRGVQTIAEREYGFFEFITTDKAGKDVFTYSYFTKRGNELVVFTITSSAAMLSSWSDRLTAIVETTAVTSG